MNDFTKEELDNLKYGINKLIDIGSCDSTWNADIRDLKNKIQNMMDNYCDHDFKMNMHDAEWHCCKCGLLQ